MKKKKGFTLIELLAVIIIIAVIALISVPLIIGLISRARKQTASVSAKNYVNIIQREILTSSLLENKKYSNGEYTIDEIDVEMDGEKPTAGIYQLIDGKVVNGTFCFNGYTVTYENNKAVTGEECNEEDIKLTSTLKVENNSVFLTYPDTDTIQITENVSGGEITCETSNPNVSTCEIDGNSVRIITGEEEGTAIITITSHGDEKYKDATISVVVSNQKGLLNVNANNYEGIYDGNAHGISVTSSGAMIMYGIEEGTYDLDINPTYSDVGTYTVYYQVTKAGYNTVTGSKTVTITQAQGEIELSSSSGTVVYGEEKEINVTGAGELSASVTDTNVVSAEIVNGKLVIRGLNVGQTTVTVTSAATNNYTEVSTTYTINVTKANNILTLSSSTGSVTYPESITFEVTGNPGGGALSCESSNTNAATCTISGPTVTVTAGTEAASSVIITVRSAGTSNYNAGQVSYVVTSENGLMSVTAEEYNGIYDGVAHGINVESSGATIKYGTEAGTYNLTSSPTYTNVGTYTVYYQVTKAGYTTVTGNKTVTITKANGSVNAPTAKTLTYTGSSQELINAGSSSTGIIEYKLGTGEYSVSIPTAIDDGTYTVYYRVVGDGNHEDVTEKSISVTINKANLTSTAEGYNGIYDGVAHGISVTSAGATIKYGTSEGIYNLEASPTYSDVGTYTVYYQITKTGYNPEIGSKTVTITQANNTLTLSSSTGSVTYPESITFEVTTNTSGGELSCLSSNTNAATCSVNGTTVTVTAGTTAASSVTITVTSAATKNYKQASAAYVVTSENGLMSVTAEEYNGIYDGNAHGISVSSSGATIKYGEISGTYNLTSSPTYTNAGTYTVYYQVTRAGYTTVTGSKTVSISKANGSLTAPTAKSLTYTGSAQALINAGSSTTGTIEYKLGTGVYSASIPTATNDGTYTIYYRVVGDINHEDVAEKSLSVTISKATLMYTADGYSGIYDGVAHGISVSSSDATIKYGESNGTYNLDASPTYSEVGTYTVYYEITRTGYTTVTGSANVAISQANGKVTLSSSTGTVTYPDSTTLTVTENISGGSLSCTSSNTNAATCSVSGTTVTVTAGTTAASSVTITVTSAATKNYKQASAAYVVTSENGLMSVTANDYSGIYDGKAHGISVSSDGATIKYGESSGTYNLTTNPTYTNVGTYTVYYQVTRTGYKTVTGSKTVTITKANGSVTAPTAKTLTYNGSAQALINAGSSNTGTIQYKLGTGSYSTTIPTATNDGTYTVYYRVVGDGNHEDVAEKSLSVTINKATLIYTANGYSGTYDGVAHGISVSSDGATIKYGTTSGTYNLTTNPTYSEVGTYTVYYQITRTGYTTVTGSANVAISQANGKVTLSSSTGTVTYPNSTTFTVTENISGGTLGCSSSNTNAATCSVSGTTVTVTPGTTAANNVTITVTSAATKNYKQASAAYVVTSKNGALSVTANDYSGTFDGAAHGISVSSSGATIKYGTTSGTYNLTTSPTYTNVGTYTVYYQVTKAGYTTVTGSKTVTIGALTAGNVSYGKNGKSTVEAALDDLFNKFS